MRWFFYTSDSRGRDGVNTMSQGGSPSCCPLFAFALSQTGNQTFSNRGAWESAAFRYKKSSLFTIFTSQIRLLLPGIFRKRSHQNWVKTEEFACQTAQPSHCAVFVLTEFWILHLLTNLTNRKAPYSATAISVPHNSKHFLDNYHWLRNSLTSSLRYQMKSSGPPPPPPLVL